MKIDKEKHKVLFNTSIQSMKYKYIFYILKRKNNLFNITFCYLKERIEVYCKDCRYFENEKCEHESNKACNINKNFKEKLYNCYYKNKPYILNKDNYCKNYIYNALIYVDEKSGYLGLLIILLLLVVLSFIVLYTQKVTTAEMVFLIIMINIFILFIIYFFLIALKIMFKFFF